MNLCYRQTNRCHQWEEALPQVRLGMHASSGLKAQFLGFRQRDSASLKQRAATACLGQRSDTSIYIYMTTVSKREPGVLAM